MVGESQDALVARICDIKIIGAISREGLGVQQLPTSLQRRVDGQFAVAVLINDVNRAFGGIENSDLLVAEDGDVAEVLEETWIGLLFTELVDEVERFGCSSFRDLLHQCE